MTMKAATYARVGLVALGWMGLGSSARAAVQADAGRPPELGGDADSAPRPVGIPAQLRQRIPQLELSGLTWAPELGRYLVVVDDTIDAETAERHAPFVLAMDREGRLDAEPVSIAGIERLDDAESLTGDGHGTYFLLTSHSLNRHGKVKPARRQLLRMVFVEHRLRVTGALDLLEGADDVRAALPAGSSDELPGIDLEGLAFYGGALYLGLKWPLMEDGSAIVLRMAHPAEVFTRGRLGPRDLVFWGKVALQVPNDAGPGPIAEGIADLLFAPDGSIFACANSPKGRPWDGGGAVWRLRSGGGGDARGLAGGKIEATLLRRYRGLKPEGVAVAPGLEGGLTVVFDRGREDPLWAFIRLPSPLAPSSAMRPAATATTRSRAP